MEEKNTLDLGEIRKEIDRTDRMITENYHRRMELVEQVARYKIATGKAVLDRSREAQKLEALTAGETSEFDKRAVSELFVQLMAISRKMQYGLLREQGRTEKIPLQMVDELDLTDCTVCYQGVEGAYSHAVVRKYFGDQARSYHVALFEDVMKEVAEGRADYGVLPIENSSAGTVTGVYNLLTCYDSVIVAEEYIQVQHGLLGLPGAELNDIRIVYSHPQALMQCAGYLKNHPGWKSESLVNTAVSAKKVADDGDISQAAIASTTAAELYGLKVLESPINDNTKNTTRFVIVHRQKIFRKDAGKISIAFQIPHESGSLYRILSHLMFNGLNMTKIESSPIPDEPFEYRFFVDLEGNLMDPAVENALTCIREETTMLRILGNY